MRQWVLSSTYYSYNSNGTSRCNALEDAAFESLAIFLLARSAAVVRRRPCSLLLARSSVPQIAPCTLRKLIKKAAAVKTAADCRAAAEALTGDEH